MSTRLPLYRMLNAPLGRSNEPAVDYLFLSDEGLNPGATEVNGNQYALGKDSDWNPAEHPLAVQCLIHRAPLLHAIFGPEGVAGSGTEVLLALEWASADSCWRALGPVHGLRHEDGGIVALDITLEPGTVRGSGFLSVQAFLGKSQTDSAPGFAQQAGARLGPLTQLVEVVIDGDGSLFPVLEESLGAEGPLWELKACWSDPQDEPFSSEYVALVLNNAHAHFDQLRDRGGLNFEQSPLLRQVFAAWLALVVAQVKHDMGADFDTYLAAPDVDDGFGSIADAVRSFIRLGSLNTASLNELFVSTQCWLDQRVRDLENVE
ncbi:hypothetical protein SFA35_07310 [Pseudomonas sp. HR96]|uniref:hypothetical protein n=1 Tax=Pseudomonas sp. HR96 TaxID=1027966 RepID=UPI002A75F1FA|nr:hypothetical protein [Pseudomonas sp. HR96]WPP01158.1 hypothetical protein SFA35_07310 [Pseudomonas sp. HR96]